jgi:hypothetical protein
MKRGFNTIIKDKNIIRHLSKDNSYNTGKNKKFHSKYSNNLDRKPLNYFLSSCKYINLKDKNKDNYKNITKREYSIKNPKVNNTLNDIYDTINKINLLNKKIQKILYNPHRKYSLSHRHSNYNKQNIILLEKYKQIKLDKLNDMYDNELDSFNNKYENKFNKTDYLREEEEYMNCNDESSKENYINQFFINLKLNGYNNRNVLNRNREFNRNNTNYNFNKYFKINDDEKIDDEYINKVKEKNHIKEHKLDDNRNTKNIFRNRKRYNSLNTDLNSRNKEKIIDNLKNIKYKKFNMSENIKLFNNSRFSDEKKDISKNSINNDDKTDCSLNYDYGINSIISRK